LKNTRILIVDDHQVVIEGIKRAFLEHPEFIITGTALNGHDAVSAVKSSKPDIVVMDISMPDLNGIDATLQIKRFDPGISIIVFTMYSHTEYVLDLFSAGIGGYVLKEDSLSELVMAIEATRAGGTYFTAPVQKIIMEHLKSLKSGSGRTSNPLDALSLREREVFQLLARGTSIKEIAAKLGLSTKTVETHKYNLMAKLGARSISDLTRLAIRHKYIDAE